MTTGWYLPDVAASIRAQERCFDFNALRPSDPTRREALARIVGAVGAHTTVLSPFLCDYGPNVRLGSHVFVNHGAYFMDGSPITVRDHVFIGPDCGLYTAIHPLVAAERNTNVERSGPIVIEDDVWLGGRVTVCPGVTIHRGAVVGAGSVVTRDVPANVVAAGNPCRVLRPLTDADRTDPAELVSIPSWSPAPEQ